MIMYSYGLHDKGRIIGNVTVDVDRMKLAGSDKDVTTFLVKDENGVDVGIAVFGLKSCAGKIRSLNPKREDPF